MGTKVEYSINLLATSVDSNNLTVGEVDIWEHYQNKGLANSLHSTGITYKVQDPMDRMLDRNNTEYIKRTMQMHEDIFKHQVRELHRVYSVQRMLMDELQKETSQQKLRNPLNGIVVSHPDFIEQQHQTTQTSYGVDFHVQSFLREERGSRERSGSWSGDTIKIQRGFDLERPAEEEIFIGARGFDEGEAGPSSYTALQNCKISSGGSDEEMEVDLTLSIGGSHVKKPHVHQLSCSESPNGKTRVGECNDPTTSMSSSSVTFTQERKGPHWLSQGLKLK